MLDWLLGGGKSPQYWKQRDREEKTQHKKAVNGLKADIAETQYLIASTERQIEITELQTELVSEQTKLAGSQTELAQKGQTLSKGIDRLKDTESKYKEVAKASGQDKLFGLF